MAGATAANGTSAAPEQVQSSHMLFSPPRLTYSSPPLLSSCPPLLLFWSSWPPSPERRASQSSLSCSSCSYGSHARRRVALLIPSRRCRCCFALVHMSHAPSLFLTLSFPFLADLSRNLTPYQSLPLLSFSLPPCMHRSHSAAVGGSDGNLPPCLPAGCAQHPRVLHRRAFRRLLAGVPSSTGPLLTSSHLLTVFRRLLAVSHRERDAQRLDHRRVLCSTRGPRRPFHCRAARLRLAKYRYTCSPLLTSPNLSSPLIYLSSPLLYLSFTSPPLLTSPHLSC